MLQPAQRLEGVERLVVGGVGVLGARNLPQMGVLRPDGRVIQPGADAVRRADATVGILQYIGTRAVQHAEPPVDRVGEASRVLPALDAMPAALHADEGHALIIAEGVEQADGIAAAARNAHIG